MANPQGMRDLPIYIQHYIHCPQRTQIDLMIASFTFAKAGKPQCIAHRGYKAAFPENTMGAFKGAVEVGAHAIETDIHLSKDGVVVISHVRATLPTCACELLEAYVEKDANLKRCFGKEDKIIDCDWSYLKTLRTLKAPQQAMPRLRDLLEYLTTPGLEDIWILLDIKVYIITRWCWRWDVLTLG